MKHQKQFQTPVAPSNILGRLNSEMKKITLPTLGRYAYIIDNGKKCTFITKNSLMDPDTETLKKLRLSTTPIICCKSLL